MKVNLTSLGAAKTVTGSKHLISINDFHILVDCGLYQGEDQKHQKNQINFLAKDINAVILTHAHLDHCGYLPKLVKDGFNGPIFCTQTTRQIAPIIQRDSAKIETNELRRKRRKSNSDQMPLYGEADIRLMEKFIQVLDYESPHKIGPCTLTLHQAGHIPGACSAGLKWEDGNILFSGDLGRFDDPFTYDPKVSSPYENIVLESTYGGVNHPSVSQVEELKNAIEKCIQKTGVLLIPAFSLARTQSILFRLYETFEKYPQLKCPIFADGPMSNEINQVLIKNTLEYKGDLKELIEDFSQLTIIAKHWESGVINKKDAPKIIISSSGMLTGGKVMGYLNEYIEDPSATIFLPGFQAKGTIGKQLTLGVETISIEGIEKEVNAEIIHSHVFSAHADENELVKWVRNLGQDPKMIFLVHGEELQIDQLGQRLTQEFKDTKIEVPLLNKKLDLFSK